MPGPTRSDILEKVNRFDRRALIVDDSAAFCAAATRLLESAGVTVVGTASTTAAALRSAKENCPDLILVDIDLGAESGFDVVEALLAASHPARPDVILVSTHDEDDFADMVESSSAIGFLPKFGLSADAIMDLSTRG
ncbi:response regulator [Rhodococcus sp. 05-2255-1e]|uniref:response regulator n=1 Tax=Nocardiaceae TaxID=85025 RepID=UPI00050C3B13|nr:response regulator [Rhodococcus sp. 05-2255-1e]